MPAEYARRREPGVVADHGIPVDDRHLVEQGLIDNVEADNTEFERMREETSGDWRDELSDDDRYVRHQPTEPREEVAEPQQQPPQQLPPDVQQRLYEADQLKASLQQAWQLEQQRLAMANAIPELAQDPVGHFHARLNQHEQALTQQYNQTRFEAAVNEVGRLANEFTQQNPDFPQALAHLAQRRDRDLELMGISDPQQRLHQIGHEARQLCMAAGAQNKNPAAVIYDMAINAGYNAGMPNAGDRRRGRVALERHYDRVRAGQQHSRSIGNMRGSGPVPVTAQRLLEMSPKQFAEFAETRPNDFRNIMGR